MDDDLPEPRLPAEATDPRDDDGQPGADSAVIVQDKSCRGAPTGSALEAELAASFLQSPIASPELPDKPAFADFYRDFLPKLVVAIIMAGIDKNEAPDIAQETMIAAHSAWNTINTPKAWARKVAIRKCIARHRSTAERPAEAFIIENALYKTPGASSIDFFPETDQVRFIIAQLPYQQRMALMLAAFEYTPAESADLLNSNAGAVRNALHAARKKLREATSGSSLEEER